MNHPKYDPDPHPYRTVYMYTYARLRLTHLNSFADELLIEGWRQQRLHVLYIILNTGLNATPPSRLRLGFELLGREERLRLNRERVGVSGAQRPHRRCLMVWRRRLCRQPL